MIKSILDFPFISDCLKCCYFETGRMLHDQPFLQLLYQTMFIIAYYGMFRACELTQSSHVVKAKDVHVATNKQKILMVLYTSKTHGLGNFPQEIKITALSNNRSHHFCPFALMRSYMKF